MKQVFGKPTVKSDTVATGFCRVAVRMRCSRAKRTTLDHKVGPAFTHSERWSEPQKRLAMTLESPAVFIAKMRKVAGYVLARLEAADKPQYDSLMASIGAAPAHAA